MRHNTPSPRPTSPARPEGLCVRTRLRAGLMGGGQAGGAGGLGGIGNISIGPSGYSGTVNDMTDI